MGTPPVWPSTICTVQTLNLLVPSTLFPSPPPPPLSTGLGGRCGVACARTPSPASCGSAAGSPASCAAARGPPLGPHRAGQLLARPPPPLHRRRRRLHRLRRAHRRLLRRPRPPLRGQHRARVHPLRRHHRLLHRLLAARRRQQRHPGAVPRLPRRPHRGTNPHRYHGRNLSHPYERPALSAGERLWSESVRRAGDAG